LLVIRDLSLRWWPRRLLPLLHRRVHLLRWEIVVEAGSRLDGGTAAVGGSMAGVGTSGTGMRFLKLRHPLALDPVRTRPDLSDGTQLRRRLRRLTSMARRRVALLLLLPEIRCYVLIAILLDIWLLVALRFVVSAARS
jgi:hypothetical protein